MIPYGRQDVTDADVEAVVAVLRSDFLTQGPVVPRFEAALAQYCGAPHAVAVNSATSALHIACMALGLGPGDWLWTSPITFVASSNCGLYCGAQVDFVDIDPRTYNLCPDALERKLLRAQAEGRLPKVVVPVHFAGQPCDMRRIHALAQRFSFKLIEDASHAVGGRYLGQPVGDCRYSDVVVFSFHPVKIITTGEGGMAVTRDARLAARMARLRSHGVTRDAADMTHAPDGPWYYQQIDLGYNYRMTELQAVLGESQLQRIDDYVARRHALAARYDRLLEGLPVQRPWQHPDGYSGLHLYVVRITADAQVQRDAVFARMRQADVGVNVHYIPVHTQPYYQQLGVTYDALEESMRYYAEAISLPMFPGLDEAQQDAVVDALQRSLAP
ncbi:MAG: UDP-4-amino-4,6-dideoxy-N-acetyl-beta-L-altrosamine transaminase [Burkholderiales bacterium]|nr:UDP-4-amino-4,6-dideoxy-N-acetyl-beta-L-altrosamine transaminase [Burkholderiales bacterium]